MDNPFERYDIDPRDGIVAITQRLKELAEDAKDDAERERIRAAWEELTLHPARRLRAALLTAPETRPPLGAAPPLPRRRAQGAQTENRLGLRDLAFRPYVRRTLGGAAEARTATGGTPTRTNKADEAPSLDDDPVFDDAP
jgi:hypothetical protein